MADDAERLTQPALRGLIAQRPATEESEVAHHFRQHLAPAAAQA